MRNKLDVEIETPSVYIVAKILLGMNRTFDFL